MTRFSSFAGSTLRRQRAFEDEDPTSGLSNLADCMLVLACGLMVALVVAWNIDIANVTPVQLTDNAVETSDLEIIDGTFESGGTVYVDMGRVYQDPETGKLYIIQDTGAASGEHGEGEGSSAGSTSAEPTENSK